jgi:hypothetical protein
MSGLKYDDAAYSASLRQLVGPGHYQLMPLVGSHCGACLPGDPRVSVGVAPGSSQGSRVDIESELHNITRRATRAPDGLYRGDGSGPVGVQQQLTPCAGPTAVDTRLVNPPCTLRGTGWNRWEWLCSDPQAHVHSMLPFDANVDTSLVVKDTHRPRVQRPLDQSSLLPPLASAQPPMQPPIWTCTGGPQDDFTDIQYRTCGEVARSIGNLSQPGLKPQL